MPLIITARTFTGRIKLRDMLQRGSFRKCCSALEEQEARDPPPLLGCLDSLLAAYSLIHSQGHHEPAARSLQLLENLATLVTQRLGNSLAGVDAPDAPDAGIYCLF